MATPFSVEISVEVSGAHFLSQATRDAVKYDLENQMQTYGLYPRPRVTWIDDTHVSVQIVVDGEQDRAGVVQGILDPGTPAWSSDGRWLAFRGTIGGQTGTWSVDTLNHHLTLL